MCFIVRGGTEWRGRGVEKGDSTVALFFRAHVRQVWKHSPQVSVA